MRCQVSTPGLRLGVRLGFHLHCAARMRLAVLRMMQLTRHAVLCCVGLAAAGGLPWKELMREFWGPLEQAMVAAQGVSTSQVGSAVRLQNSTPAPACWLHLNSLPCLLLPAPVSAPRSSSRQQGQCPSIPFPPPALPATVQHVVHSTAHACSTPNSQVYTQLEQQLEHLVFMQPRLPTPAAAADAAGAHVQQRGADGTAAAAAAEQQQLSPSALDPRRCPVCGGRLVLKPSRATGGFIGCRCGLCAVCCWLLQRMQACQCRHLQCCLLSGARALHTHVDDHAANSWM